ncbi:transposase domain-containing protein [Nocardia sp. NPDC059246]|uniref:transposase domain-containing protein n=1 Tax=unclassified Nocardia TaxID=2637762 RepID=UPI0036A49FF8
MVDAVAVRPDRVSLEVLAGIMDRDRDRDAAVAVSGARAQRSGGKLPPHVAAYLTMALRLFPGDSSEELTTKVTGALTVWGCWDVAWTVPTAWGSPRPGNGWVSR